MNYELTRNYFHSEFGNNSEFRQLNYIELIDENTKNFEVRIYREVFHSEVDKNWFYEQKTYLSIQTTVSAQKLCISILAKLFFR